MPVPRPSYPMIAARQIEMLARESGIPTELVPSVSKLFRRVLDKQAIDERLNYQWIADNMGGGSGARFATFVIASQWSTDAGKAGADYVCDGTADEVEINQALLDIVNGPWGMGKLVLLEGDYGIAEPIFVPSGLPVTIEGMGVYQATQIRPDYAGFTGTAMLSSTNLVGATLRDFRVDVPSGVIGIDFDSFFWGRIERLYLSVDPNSAEDTIRIGTLSHSTIADNWLIGGSGRIAVETGSYFDIENNEIDASGGGVF